MKLQDKLDKIRQGFDKQVPPEALETMHRVTDDLRNSGIMDRALKEGLTAPLFELENPAGERVRLSGLLAEGPVVLSFFRGNW
jgi:hypothetical protein